MWKSASASGSPWSRLTAVSLLMVSSVRTVGASGMSCVSCSARCVPDSSTRMSSGIAAMSGARMRPVSESESSGLRQTVFALLREAAQVVVELGGLALAARLGEHQRRGSQHDQRRERPPVVEERVEQRRPSAAVVGGRGRARAVSAAAVGAGVRRRLRRRRGGFGRRWSSQAAGVTACGLRPRACSTGGWRGRRLRGAACCEAASLACRSASSVLRSSSMRLDSLSWPSSSRTRFSQRVDFGRHSPPERRARWRSRSAAPGAGGRRLPRQPRRPSEPRQAADFAARFGRRHGGDLLAAGNAQHGARAQAIHVAFERAADCRGR